MRACDVAAGKYSTVRYNNNIMMMVMIMTADCETESCWTRHQPYTSFAIKVVGTKEMLPGLSIAKTVYDTTKRYNFY